MARASYQFSSLGLGLLALLALASCGGSSPARPNPNPTPTPGPTPAPTPAPTPTPNPAPTPDASQRCAKLENGPVVRVAIAPRGQFEGSNQVPMRVRVEKAFEDEVWCIDKDKESKLDFNLNQRNANGKECCWEEDPVWRVDDPNFLVDNGEWRDDYGFIYRLRVDPKGRKGKIFVQTTLDGHDSYPWQSGSYYQQGALVIESMSASEISRDCQCTFKGNGQYEGDRCSK
jgi:hypothetical protein